VNKLCGYSFQMALSSVPVILNKFRGNIMRGYWFTVLFTQPCLALLIGGVSIGWKSDV
jgi:hypothetical protein